MNKYVFKRYELKYILTPKQYNIILKEIKNHLSLDQYGETTIQSLYYDTDSYRLIRNSIERPDYKEKIRVRGYGVVNEDTKVYLELKKKNEKVVYKRRIEIKVKDIEDFINGRLETKTQIEKEIVYFCNFYGELKPSLLLLYEREAYSKEGEDLRITFDKNTRYRVEDLKLSTNLQGTPLLDKGEILMEIKTSKGYPWWLVDLLNKNKVYKSRFSKYGTAYQLELKKKKQIKKGEECYV